MLRPAGSGYLQKLQRPRAARARATVNWSGGRGGGRPRIAADPELRQMSLARWELKGSPETWREQLEEYYRKEPVFALLGGITTKEWRPVHEFSEDHAIPCLFPITDLPFVSPNGWYTLYFSKGYYQEGERRPRGTSRERRTRLREEPSFRCTPFRRKEKPSPPVSGMPGANPAAAPWSTRSIPAGHAGHAGKFWSSATGTGRRAVLALWTGAEALPPLDAAARQGRRRIDGLPVGDPSQGRAPDRARRR